MRLLRRRAAGIVGLDVTDLRRDDERIALVEIVECTVLRRPIFILDILPGKLTVRRATMVLSIGPAVDVRTAGGDQ